MVHGSGARAKRECDEARIPRPERRRFAVDPASVPFAARRHFEAAAV